MTDTTEDQAKLAAAVRAPEPGLRERVQAAIDDTPEQSLAAEILAELTRARTKFPGDNVTMLALMEEVGELSKATFEEPRAAVRKEAVQVATMAMRVVLDGDATLDGWRSARGLDPLVAPVAPPAPEVSDEDVERAWQAFGVQAVGDMRAALASDRAARKGR